MMDRRGFTKSVGLFSAYIAFGGPRVGAAAAKPIIDPTKPLIVTPAEYQEEVRQRVSVTQAVMQGDVAHAAVLNSRGEIVGATPFHGGPRRIDWGDSLEVTVTGTARCGRCGATAEAIVFEEHWNC